MKCTFLKILCILILVSCNLNSEKENILKDKIVDLEHKDETLIESTKTINNGVVKTYFSNGNIESEINYLDGIIVGDAYFYFNSKFGKLKQYVLFNKQGYAIFKINYNIEGEILFAEGIPIDVSFIRDKDSLFVGDTLLIGIKPACAPGIEISSEYGSIDDDDIFNIQGQYIFSCKELIFSKVFTKAGEYRHTLIFSLKKSNDQLIYSDSLMFISHSYEK